LYGSANKGVSRLDSRFVVNGETKEIAFFEVKWSDLGIKEVMTLRIFQKETTRFHISPYRACGVRAS